MSSIQDIKKHLESTDHGWTISEIESGLEIRNVDDVPVHLVVTEEQMLVETILFPESVIEDVASFDNTMMFAQKGLPLSSVGKSQINNETYYVAFGALSSASKLDNVELEITVLYQNIAELLHFSSDFIKSK